MGSFSPPEAAAGEGGTVADAWDYRGRPAIRCRTGGWRSAATIVVVEVNERLVSMGIAVNLVTYLTGTMHLGSAESANTVTNFLGVSFILTLFGGFVADTFFGRYLTIAVFTVVQATGVTILTISTALPSLRPPKCDLSTHGPCIPSDRRQLFVLYFALYLTALGTGGLKSSVSGFGSDQFDETDNRESTHMIKFFNWFIFFISFGSLLAVTVLVYIQDHLGRFLGYGLIALCVFVGLLVFLSGTRRYRFKKLVGSPLTQVAAVVVSAWKKRKVPIPSEHSLLYDVWELPETRKRKKQALPHTDQFRFLDHAAIKDSPETSAASEKPSKWRLNTLTDVEEVKQVIRMLPIWATTILFWTVYAQMTTFSVSQATTMDRHITSTFEIPSGSLAVFLIGSILLTVPVYDRLVLPHARRLTRNPQGLTPLQRIGVGLALSVAAMAAAALTETHRRGRRSVRTSVFYLAPQFFFVGSGVGFTHVGQLQFFLRECPAGMKTMSAGLFMSTMALGCFLSTALVAATNKVTGKEAGGRWLTDDLNEGRLYNFYWLLAVLGLINLVFFALSARWYVYKESRVREEEDDGINVVVEIDRKEEEQA